MTEPHRRPAERLDRRRSHGRQLIDARNIAVTFKVEDGIVEAVQARVVPAAQAARRSPSSANPVRANR